MDVTTNLAIRDYCDLWLNKVNLLLSGKDSVSVAKFMAGGSLVALEKNKPNCPLDVHPIAVGKTLRRLASKYICAIVKNKVFEFFSPFQLVGACPSGAEKNHSCLEKLCG